MSLPLNQFRQPLLVLVSIVYSLVFYFSFVDVRQWLLFVLGCIGGSLLLIMDERFAWRWYNERFSAAQQLITRSLLFVGVYLLLALYIVTSAGSSLGSGLVMGLGLGVVLEMWLFKQDVGEFQNRFAWQVNHVFTPVHVTRLVQLFSVFMAVLTVLLVVS
jgi:hypothetical protein